MKNLTNVWKGARPYSLVKTILKNDHHKLNDDELKSLKEIINQDWNFRMVLKETNRKWLVNIAKLNRSFH
jgi:hypothetical protein